MKIITIDEAVAHCRTDGIDNDVLTIYADAAERACEQLANRSIFATQEDLAAAIQAIPATMAAAFTAYNEARDAAGAFDADNKEVALDMAEDALLRARVAANNALYGIVATEDIKAAVLMTTAKFYREREDGEPPEGAQRIMRWYRRVGPL